MDNAETAGFSGGAYQVYTRQPHELAGSVAAAPLSPAPVAAVTIATDAAVHPLEPPEKAG